MRIVLPLEQLLQERASLLRYTYVACRYCMSDSYSEIIFPRRVTSLTFSISRPSSSILYPLQVFTIHCHCFSVHRVFSSSFVHFVSCILAVRLRIWL
jgi:hypothetical protein